MPRSRAIVLITLLGMPSCVLSATVFNVSTAAQFQAALVAAEANGTDDTINLSAGPAYRTNDNGGATFIYSSVEPHSLTIQGAGVGQAILDGDGVRQVLSVQAGGAGAVALAGVTVRNAGGSHATTFDGGAVLLRGTAATVADCSFENNSVSASGTAIVTGGILAVLGGTGGAALNATSFSGNNYSHASDNNLFGGVVAVNGSPATVSDVTAVSNRVTVTAGGPSVNVFGGLFAVTGGAATSATRVLVSGPCSLLIGGAGTATVFGGILDLSGIGTTTVDQLHVTGCSVIQGTDDDVFGGILAADGQGGTIVARSELVGNSVIVDTPASAMLFGGIVGAGFSQAATLFANNAIGANNSASVNGDVFGTVSLSGSPQQIIHNSVWGNVIGAGQASAGAGFDFGQGGVTVDLYNNIVWGNLSIGAPDDIHIGSGSNTINYFNNDVAAFTNSGGGSTVLSGANVNLDPLLAGLTNFHLTAASPVIDRGLAAAPQEPAIDLDGDPRNVGAAPDMGADELSSVIAVPVLSPAGFVSLAVVLVVAGLVVVRSRRPPEIVSARVD